MRSMSRETSGCFGTTVSCTRLLSFLAIGARAGLPSPPNTPGSNQPMPSFLADTVRRSRPARSPVKMISSRLGSPLTNWQASRLQSASMNGLAGLPAISTFMDVRIWVNWYGRLAGKIPGPRLDLKGTPCIARVDTTFVVLRYRPKADRASGEDLNRRHWLLLGNNQCRQNADKLCPSLVNIQAITDYPPIGRSGTGSFAWTSRASRPRSAMIWSIHRRLAPT